MSPLLPPPPESDSKRGVTIVLPTSIWDRLDEVVTTENESRPKEHKLSRTEVIEHFLDWAIQDFWREKRAVTTAMARQAAAEKEDAELEQEEPPAAPSKQPKRTHRK